jgi:23S rRNA maturation mini-RNase III
MFYRNIMSENVQSSVTASDYKEFFLTKFSDSLINLVKDLINVLDDTSLSKQKLLKISNFLNNKNINYPKLIEKLCKNDKIMPNLSILKDSNINLGILNGLIEKSSSKDWLLIPEFYVDKILLELNDNKIKENFIDEVKNIYVCATSYSEIITMINESDTTDDFNPFSKISQNKDLKDIDINSMFKDVEYKQMTSYEMLIRMLVDNKTEAKVGEYMNNIKEDDVNEAASKLDDVLKNNEINSDASKLLASMLANIKDEVINLGNTNNNNIDGKDAMKNLMNIAKKVAGNMSVDVQNSGLTPMEIWKATSSLAKSTVKSDALDIVDGIITQNIQDSMNGTPGSDAQNLQNKMKMMNLDEDDDNDNY